MNTVLGITALSFLLSQDGACAQQMFSSREDFHENTPYGALAFNKSARTPYENRYVYKNFILVQNGQVDLPDQSGFCFLLNHYNSPNALRTYTYTFTVTEWFADGTSSGAVPHVATYIPTDRSSSWDYPDYCLRKLYNLTKVDVQISGTEGVAFQHHFVFKVTP